MVQQEAIIKKTVKLKKSVKACLIQGKETKDVSYQIDGCLRAYAKPQKVIICCVENRNYLTSLMSCIEKHTEVGSILYADY